MTGVAIADSGLAWPLTLQRALSSTFGETRATAFHVGIDLKTWGKTGYEVHALADGYIMRLRTSPWGYGRAVYERLADGRIVVYAHLDSFAPAIADRVRAAQRETQRYTVNLWLAEGEIPVRKGEVIGRSGQTGIGFPHLHLELRDADNVPVNPLSYGFTVADRSPPTIRRIALTPVGLGSGVNGGHRSRTVAVRWRAERDRFEAVEKVTGHGTIGVSVLGYDRAEAASNKLAPFSNRLIVDGKTAVTAVYERVPYGDAYQIGLDRLVLGGGEKPDVYFNLFRLPGNRLAFYRTEEGSDGLLRLNRGSHVIEVVSADAAGNESRARLHLVIDKPPRIDSARIVAEAGHLFLEANASDAEAGDLAMKVEEKTEAGKWRELQAQRVASGAGPFTWALPGVGSVWRLTVEDSSGQTAFRTFALSSRPTTGADGPTQAVAAPSGADGPKLTVERQVYADFVDLLIRAEGMLAEAPRVSVWPQGSSGGVSPDPEILTVVQTGQKQYTVTVPVAVLSPSTGSRSADETGTAGWPRSDSRLVFVEIRARAANGSGTTRRIQLRGDRVVPGEPQALAFGGGEAVLSFGEGSVYEAITPQAESFEPRGNEELASTAVGYAFGPEKVSFNRRVKMALRLPREGVERPDRLAVYAEGGDGEWVFLGNELDVVGWQVSAQVRQLGRFALLADERPPTVRITSPPSGSVTEDPRPLLTARVLDGGSGIGREEDVIMALNGKRLISVYDPEADRVEFQVEEDLAPGEYRLDVTGRDRCGNETRTSSSFRIRR